MASVENTECLLKDFFPTNYEYKVVRSGVTEHTGLNVKFDIELRVNVNMEEGVKTFLSDFNKSSQCTFNMRSGRQDRSQSFNLQRVQEMLHEC